MRNGLEYLKGIDDGVKTATERKIEYWKRMDRLIDLCRRLVALDPPKRYGESVMSVLHGIAAIVGEKECSCGIARVNGRVISTGRDDCPLHGQKDPDPPLRVKVAELLGKDTYFIALSRQKPCWFSTNKPYSSSHSWYESLVPILPYDTDLKAAMGALVEYKIKNSIRTSIDCIANSAGSVFWKVMLSDDRLNPYKDSVGNDSLPTAICEAIVAHGKQK